MDDYFDFLPTSAIRAFTTLCPAERRARGSAPHKLRLAELDGATAALEVNSGEVILRLARDCPFGEISPAYLAIFVHRLSELCPDVGVAYLEGYHHPIVATSKLEVPADASAEAWTAAIQLTLVRLEGALSRQDEAARVIKGDSPFKWINVWPEVEVSPEQLALIGSFADRFAEASLSGELQQLWWVEEDLRRYLRRLSVLKPGQSWLHCLCLDELRSGFFDGVRVEHFTASQLVVTLNAVYDGNAYNKTLVNRACSSGLLARLTARARELAGG
jgi:hypothetical protein